MVLRMTPGNRFWLFTLGERRAARKAIDRCYGIPRLKELSKREHHGMLLLEQAGIVHRDEGFSGLHWHLTERGRRWLIGPNRYWGA